MKLISNNPIFKLRPLNLSRQQFGDVKTLLAYGERLKVTEQRLLFLKRCKKQSFFPKFIDNSILIKNHNSLFPISVPKKMNECIENLKTKSLCQVISHQYFTIGRIKAHITQYKQRVRNIVNQGQYSLIIDIFTCNNCTVKSNEKERLIKKFEWLSEQHCERTPTAALSSSTSEHVDLSPIDEPANDRITTIQVDLSEQEQALLALGPNFALSPKVDERLINQINMEVAACAVT